MSDIAIARLRPEDVGGRVNEFTALYRQVYAEPPYCEGDADAAAFAERFADEQTWPGFALIAAQTDDRLIGFAHGVTFPATSWWSSAGPEPDETRNQPKFAIMELVVAPDHRRHGIASKLLATLLQDRPEPYATLCSNPVAPARGIYRQWGWRQVSQAHPTIGAMDVLLMDLRR